MKDKWGEIADQSGPLEYEVLIIRESTEESLLEGAVTNAFGVDGLIKQFCRQNLVQREVIMKDLESDGHIEILGNMFHNMQYRMFVWTVKVEDNEF